MIAVAVEEIYMITLQYGSFASKWGFRHAWSQETNPALRVAGPFKVISIFPFQLVKVVVKCSVEVIYLVKSGDTILAFSTKVEGRRAHGIHFHSEECLQWFVCNVSLDSNINDFEGFESYFHSQGKSWSRCSQIFMIKIPLFIDKYR